MLLDLSAGILIKTESDLDQTQIGYAIAKGAVFVATFIIASSVGLTNHSR